MTLIAVATGFVSDAMSKTVSTVIFSTAGATARFPYALRKTTLPCLPTSTTAPGHSFRAMASSTTASIRPRRSADMPAEAGGAEGREKAGTAAAARRSAGRTFTPEV